MTRKIKVEDQFLVEYQEVGEFIRHYSIVRSALVSFLVTVGATAFGAFFVTEDKPSFLIVFGLVTIVAAFFSCLYFSYMTEKANLYLTEIWKWFNDGTEKEPAGFKSYRNVSQTWKKVAGDFMNWLFFIGSSIILFTFFSGKIN